MGHTDSATHTFTVHAVRTDADTDALRTALAAYVATWHDHDPTAWPLHDQELVSHAPQPQHTPPHGDAWVALDDTGQPIGCAMLRRDGSDAEIEKWFVREDWRRRGVGSRLITEAVLGARTMGCWQISALVANERVRSRALLYQFGFVTVRSEKHPGFVRMSMVLPR